jgi:uncharacterized protein
MGKSPKQTDVMRRTQPDSIQMRGLVGQRHQGSRLNRIHHQEEDHLLFPFHEHCPVGWMVPNRPRPEIRGDWQGEYIGTWLDAAILSAWNAADKELLAKIHTMVEDLLSTQQEDGYLGTYDEIDRWKSWDIWVQVHNLIGLLSYYRYTGSQKAFTVCVNIANRVLKDFGPGLRAVRQTGHNVHGYGDYGMASSSILEPLIWLYWETGDQRYLEWGKWLVDEDWEAPDGPRIVSSLLAGRGVAGTANAKGIEMLICFAGMIELYRATGDRHYLDPVLIAWKDIVEHHLYLTGTASTGEFFTANYLLRNDGSYRLGETCVSMGWLYLNLSLGCLFGEASYFDMAEQTLYNHLLAAQSPDGKGWAYYVGLRDSKRYRWHTDPECCPTRGIRALAVIPQHVFCQDDRVIRDEKTQFPHLVVHRVVEKPTIGRPFWKEKERYYDFTTGDATTEIEDLELVPFFDAGNRQPKMYREGINPHDEPVTNFTYQVWLPYDLHTIDTGREGREI